MPQKPIEKLADDIQLLKLDIEELKRELKKINVRLKARDSIIEEKEKLDQGWVWSPW